MAVAQVGCVDAQMVDGYTKCLDATEDNQKTSILTEAFRNLLLQPKDIGNSTNSSEHIDAEEDNNR